MSISLLSPVDATNNTGDFTTKISRDYTDDYSLPSTTDHINIDTEIKTAYKDKNPQRSRSLHIKKKQSKYFYYASNKYNYVPGREGHKGSIGEFMKSIIFGGMDGIITLFAIVASINGGGTELNLPTTIVLILGFSKLIGDAISMGIGDFLSEKAEIDFIKSEYQREEWEFENYPKGEINEMMDIYLSKHITKKDAELILTTMSKYPKLFLSHMMQQELNLNITQINDNPTKNGCITFVSFLFFGTIPLLSYVIFYDSDINKNWNWTFTMAILLTLITLFGMGVVKGYYNNANVIRSGLFVMLNGSLAAGCAYFIGWGLSHVLD